MKIYIIDSKGLLTRLDTSSTARLPNLTCPFLIRLIFLQDICLNKELSSLETCETKN